MKSSLMFAACAAILVSSSMAQQPAAPAAKETIKGTIDITYNTRTQVDDAGRPEKGVQDVYLLDVTAGSTPVFRGEIRHQPGIYNSLMEIQPAILTFKVDVGAKNPANLSQERMVGRITGSVPIDRKGIYDFDRGTLRLFADPVGQAKELTSNFRGRAAGRPQKGSETLMDKAKKQALTLQRQVGGKTAKIVVSDYDRMQFQDMVLAAGPARAYPETRVNGEMIYDYERSAWYFNNLTLDYMIDGKAIRDKISGNIKWVEAANRKTTGEGYYQFDIRVNEPDPQAQGEGAFFAAAEDEAAFFAVDTSVVGISGKETYKDTIRSDDVVTSSKVNIDLACNGTTKQQNVALFKLTQLVSVVPMNAE